MCGIAGFSRAPESSSIPNGRQLAIAALEAIEDRGPHSTGVAWTRGRQEQVWYHKLVGTASRVARKLDLDRKARIHSCILHTRFASQGAVNVTNAHPVVADNITLVHNGVLWNDAELVELAGIERVGEVDSWALAAIIAAQHRIGATHPAELFELVEGDYAVAWLDANHPRQMHLARGIGRPMTLGWTKRGDMVMASTRQALYRISRVTKVGIGDFIDVPTGTYLRIEAGAIKEWQDFTPAGYHRATPTRAWAPAKGTPPPAPTRRARPRPLWQPTEGSPWPSDGRGITDMVASRRAFDDGRRPSDWWDEAERLLGKALDKDDEPDDRIIWGGE